MDGAPACPFVAFGDDREARSTSPDHRHRCFAETPPAPRAVAHQEAYCLSSAFPVCPTFQDWARREAAHARGAGERAQTAPTATPTPERARPVRRLGDPAGRARRRCRGSRGRRRRGTRSRRRVDPAQPAARLGRAAAVGDRPRPGAPLDDHPRRSTPMCPPRILWQHVPSRARASPGALPTVSPPARSRQPSHGPRPRPDPPIRPRTRNWRDSSRADRRGAHPTARRPHPPRPPPHLPSRAAPAATRTLHRLARDAARP